MAKQKEFPNGFDSWMETHHEVVEFIVLHLADDDNKTGDNDPIFQARERGGTGFVYELGESWTDEFEKLNAGREWDGEFFDEIEGFLQSKLK